MEFVPRRYAAWLGGSLLAQELRRQFWSSFFGTLEITYTHYQIHGTGTVTWDWFFRCVDLGITYTIPIGFMRLVCVPTYTFQNQPYIIHVGRYTPDMDCLGHVWHDSHIDPWNSRRKPSKNGPKLFPQKGKQLIFQALMFRGELYVSGRVEVQPPSKYPQ